MSNNNLTQSKLLDNLSKEAIEDLKNSGLSDEIIQEANILPATKTNIEKYKIYWFDKNKRQKRFEPLYIIPYLFTEYDENKMCRVKVLPIPEYPNFDGKYTQPPKQVLRYSTHLYILPSELEKLKSPKCHLAIVEGEKKALKLIQEVRKLEEKGFIDYKLAVIGISGIYNWQNAPEWQKVKVVGKKVILFFDADNEINKAVIDEELRLAGFLYSKGAGSVKSAIWTKEEGKGIDDFLVKAGDKQLEKLKGLLDSVISPFEKYKRELQDKEKLRDFFKYPVRSDRTRLDYLIELVKDDVGITKKTIKSVVSSLKTELEEELKEKQQKQIKEVFELEYIHTPKGFLWEQGRLKTDKGDDLTEFFIVKEEVINQDNEVIGLTIKTVKGREFYIRTEDLNKKNITYIFNKNRTPLDESSAVKVLKYIANYQAYNPVNQRKMIEHTGWINDEYYLPQLQTGFEFHEDLKGFEKSGDREKELKLMKELIGGNTHLSLGYVLGFASTLIKPLKADNFTAFLQGKTGKGKSTTSYIGLSLFGYYHDLQANMNKTNTGIELFLDKRKDVLNVLDELNTSQGDATKEIIKIIYDFQNGKGRTRARANLTLRKTAEYRGVLAISSEDSLNNLLSKADKTVKGALRRVVVIDFSDFEDVDKEISRKVYSCILHNYGNLIENWIRYIKENEKEIINIYHNWIFELTNEDRGFSFNGQERHLAVLFTTAELINKVFNIDTENLFNYLWQIAEFNHFEFAEATQLTADRLKRKIEEFIQTNIGNFEYSHVNDNGMIIEKNTPKTKAFGKIDNKEEGEIYLTSLGLKELAKFIQVPEKELKKLLIDFRFAEKDEDRIIKRTRKKISGVSVKVYPVSL